MAVKNPSPPFISGSASQGRAWNSTAILPTDVPSRSSHRETTSNSYSQPESATETRSLSFYFGAPSATSGLYESDAESATNEPFAFPGFSASSITLARTISSTSLFTSRTSSDKSMLVAGLPIEKVSLIVTSTTRGSSSVIFSASGTDSLEGPPRGLPTLSCAYCSGGLHPDSEVDFGVEDFGISSRSSSFGQQTGGTSVLRESGEVLIPVTVTSLAAQIWWLTEPTYYNDAAVAAVFPTTLSTPQETISVNPGITTPTV
ncbi:hypothetical protein TSTA_024560 [Talaromyces stipitatus ATCC 10500]|uniref:Uncharacterized protein n=1 Tax=Talaromyces stipitatus (strain ATCC 10500 / CBS 375.48 / QM 6759 / NRRL 1006) TaxID=441959 RepID=B8M4D7_TALSN|nr:uncharacterized protein TSTA_024560 [Talaromyces stipitatus ATCC 10500]EED19132.1 hypothetical protein TSTA_024560 [Talaromyces stipitatus ATCC 10500]